MRSRPRVLLIDDDESVLKAMQQALHSEFDVTAHHDPRVALAMLLDGEEFEAIICDLMMPQLTGDALYEHLRIRRPELARRVAFVTGGATTGAAHAFLAQWTVPVLAKPYRIAELRALTHRLAQPLVSETA
jgi:CheY-like chemotaxis protein